MVIGILPAAGEAKRMHGIPKYLLPTQNGYLLKRHLEMMQEAANNGVFIGTNGTHHKWIAQNAPDAQIINVGYTATMSETVLGLQRYAGMGNVLFGMPDTYIEDEKVYNHLANLLNEPYDVAVASFPVRPNQWEKVGMLELGDHLDILNVIDKPEQTDLRFFWGALAWKPVFWNFIKADDLHVGYALQRFIRSGGRATFIHMMGHYWDCGTPDEYFALIRHLTEER